MCVCVWECECVCVCGNETSPLFLLNWASRRHTLIISTAGTGDRPSREKLQNKQNFYTFTSILFWIQGFYLYLGWHLGFYLQPNSSTIRAENSWAADVHEARRTLTKLGCKWELSSVYWPSALLPPNSDWPLKPHMFPSVEVRTSFTHFLILRENISLKRLKSHWGGYSYMISAYFTAAVHRFSLRHKLQFQTH